MPLIYALILFPLAPAAAMPLLKNAHARNTINIISSLIIIILSIAFSAVFRGGQREIVISGNAVSFGIMVLDILVSLYVIFIGIIRKKLLAPVFAAASSGLLAWFELTSRPETGAALEIDSLSILMVLIVGVIGGLICAFSGGYMQNYHRRHKEYADRTGFFFMVLYMFIFAMFGLVLSNNLLWLFLFWEITTVCSFLLIGYTRTDEAVKNAFTALTINSGGGLCFAIGIVLLWKHCAVLDLKSFLSIQNNSVWELAGIYMLGAAALTKSAQLPFSKWLLGAMVAPTPTSAMLHSSAMVKAGVYLFIRLSPLLRGNHIGMTFVIIGGLTFLLTAMMAVSQRDAKKVLAYSTVSNLGLIVTCAGIGTAESIWAAIMLMIFHAIAKSLMFLTVGVTENILGTRDLEDMDGLFNVSGTLTMLFVIGIAGMFLAPFGMLISKWAAMKAFIDSGNMMIVVLVAFGSSVTLFFWTKWLGKLIGSFSPLKTEPHEISRGQRIPLYTLAALVVAVCLCYPFISTYIIIPYLQGSAFIAPISPLSQLNNTLALTMMGALFILPLILVPVYRRNRIQRASIYLSGLNTGDSISFYGSMGNIRRVAHKNWYMEKYFGESVLLRDSAVLLWLVLLSAPVVLIGGIVYLHWT